MNSLKEKRKFSYLKIKVHVFGLVGSRDQIINYNCEKIIICYLVLWIYKTKKWLLKNHFFKFAKIEQGDKPKDDEQGAEKGRKLTRKKKTTITIIVIIIDTKKIKIQNQQMSKVVSKKTWAHSIHNLPFLQLNFRPKMKS